MSYASNVGKWADTNLKNLANDIGLPSLVHDLASVTTNDKPWVNDVFQFVGNTFKVAGGVAQLPFKAASPLFTGIDVRPGEKEFNVGLLPGAIASYNLGGNLVRENLVAPQVAAGNILRGKAPNIAEAYKQRNEISAGQASAYLQSALDPTKGELRGDFNIFDLNDRKIFDTDWEYKTLSGAYDTVYSTVTDPFGKVAKGIGLARKALAVQPLGPIDATSTSLFKEFIRLPQSIRKVTIISPATLANKINEGRNAENGLYGTLDWFAKNESAKILEHPMIKTSNDATTAAYLLGRANTVDEVADTFLAISNRDTAAMARLVSKRPDLAFVYDKIKGATQMNRNILDNVPTNGITEDPNILLAAERYVDEALKSPYIQYLDNLTTKGADFSKRTFGTDAAQKLNINVAERSYARRLGLPEPKVTGFPTVGIFQATKYHPIIAVINFASRAATQRPAGWFNSNDSDSFQEIQAFGTMLRKLVGPTLANPIVQRHIDDFILAGDSPEGRTKVAESYEILATKSIAATLNISQETADTIWNAYQGRRKLALESFKTRNFLMTNDDVILKIPYLQRQGANAKPMVDLENYFNVLNENKGLIKAIDGNHGIFDPDNNKYIAGLLNDVWKASVLLRLGYTVRNIAEAQMSILASGYGLLATADLKNMSEFGSNWYQNRIIGIERLIDKSEISKGLRDDSLVLRQKLATNQTERAQIESLNKEIDNHMAAVELAFKRGQLTEAQTLEFLNISNYRSGETLHHGSPIPIKELDKSRPLAMLFNDDIANRYAEKAMPTISASEIYKRKTGRAYPLPKNIELAPPAEMGSPAVIEQMPFEDFKEYVIPWVRGVNTSAQKVLRGQLFEDATDPKQTWARENKKFIDGLKRTIQRSEIKMPMMVRRITDNPDFGRTPVGGIVEEKGFVATTKNTYDGSEILSTYQLEIKLSKGQPGLDIESTYDEFARQMPRYQEREGFAGYNVYNGRFIGNDFATREAEVLLPPGTKLRIIYKKMPEFDADGVAQGPVEIKAEAILPPRMPSRQPSLSMQTVGADMREGFINTVNNGNQVELLNPQTGTWRSIDPNNISQELLVNGQFRIRKPNNQGQVLSKQVYGETVDLRNTSGTKIAFNLKDYPELKAILKFDSRNYTSWQGKEKEILAWMRDNQIGKLVLPDTKVNAGNSRATILVNPEMVETGTNKPTQILAKQQLKAIRDTRAVTSNESKIVQMIQSTIENGGGTFKFMSGDIPIGGVAVAVRGGTFRYSLDSAKADPVTMARQLSEHIENSINKFENADHFGLWIEPIEDGTMHIWAEPVNVIENRAEAIKIGKNRNQRKIFDLNTFEEIDTGGTGDVKASKQFALGKSRKTYRGDEPAGTQDILSATSRQDTPASLSQLANQIGSGRYPTNGITALVRDLADRNSKNKSEAENLLSKLNVRYVEEQRLNAPRKISGTGYRTTKLYNGQTIEYADVFQGEPGNILANRTDSADTYAMMADAPSQLFQARHGNMQQIRLNPQDPRYYSGYANQLNSFFRSSTENKIDPIIEFFLNGKTPEYVIKWLRRTPAGQLHAKNFNIDTAGLTVAAPELNVGTSAEDFVGNLYSSYQRYLPDAEIQEAFRANQIDEMWLRNHFKDQPTMPDIIGSTVPTSGVDSSYAAATQSIVQKLFYFLGSLPETTLARHPLARSIYRAETKQRAEVALSLKVSKGEANELTLDEINAIRQDSIESTRKEVNKTLFTIVRKSEAGEKMRYIMPFFNAWENTVRRWSGFAKDNPAVIAKAGQITASLSNQTNIVDKDGNPATSFNYDNSIILPMPETFKKFMPESLRAAIDSAGGQVRIPIRSLDVMFQGQSYAGFGPIVAIPAGELEKLRPDLESILKPIIPFGPQEGNVISAVTKSVTPPWMQKVITRFEGENSEQWSRTFNTVYRYELIKYKLGDRKTEPTFQEIRKLTDSMYTVKALSNLILPFAAQYDSPLSWYTQQYRKLQQTYGRDADVLFLQMYPQMAEATISSSLNATGVQASQKAQANIQKYKTLISKIGTTNPEMIGFLVNDPNGKYDFSESVYAWQYRNSPVPGSIENYRQQRNPALLKQDANKKMGWIDYRKTMDYLDAQLQAQGFTSFRESGAEELNLAKQLYTKQLADKNIDWARDFYSVDKGKWIYRMQTIQTMLTDKQWMQENGSRPVVGSLAYYYNTRSQIQRELASRKASGDSGALTSENNADLEGMWNQVVSQLKNGSPEFSEFFNRFLQNDPVTLG